MTIAFFVASWRPITELSFAWFEGQGYSHGPLVVAMSAYLLITRLRMLPGISADWIAIPLIAISSLLMTVGMLLHVRTVSLFFLPLLFFGIVLFAVGRRNALKVAGPIAFLYFAVPVWFPLVEVLQYGTVQAVRWMIGQTAIPANIAGNLVHVPFGTFEIANGCSGLRYVVVGLALGASICMTSSANLLSKIKILVLAFSLAAVGNWIRVFLIVKIGHDSKMTHPIVTDHSNFGWIVFVIVMLPLFLVARKEGLFDPQIERAKTANVSCRRGRRVLAPMIIALLAATAPTTYAAVVAADARRSEVEFRVEWPARTDNWVTDNIDSNWQPYFEAADYSAVRRFRSGANFATAYFSGFQFQAQGKEPDYYSNELYPGQASVRSSELIGSVHGSLVRLTLVDPLYGESTVYFRYFVGDRIALSKVDLKRQTFREIFKRNYSAGVFGVWIDCEKQCDDLRPLELELINALQWGPK